MKGCFLILLITALLQGFCANAQLLTVTPAFPKDTTGAVIVLDCSRGNKGLLGYGNTSDIYLHIAVITNLSVNSTDWKHVKFSNFNAPDASVKATYLGNNKYQFTIDTIRKFFGVPANETIFRIALLFRSGNGSLVQRNSDNSDMFIPLYTDALAGKFNEPFFEPRLIPTAEPITKIMGERVKVSYQTNNSATLKLFFNGTEINTASSVTSIVDSPLITTGGSQQLVARATDGSTTVSDTINFFVSNPVSVLPLPAGMRDGINYEQGDTSAVLVLYAPNKTRVSLLGDFNNWTENANSQLNKTPDGLRFWIRITGLTPGAEYAYQYQVDNNLKIADPYTQKILDPDDDNSITAATYPNLKPYPTGKTTGNVSILQTAEPAYAWQINNFTRPDKRNLLVYELLVRDFVAVHDWKTLKDTLNYLKNLGINAIELMPFNEFEGNLSWGYNTSFYFAPDKYYGTKNGLKEFIDECHKKGIAVIMDIAMNHSFGQSPMVQLYFDAVNNRPAADNPWFNPVPKHAFNVGYDMNHESAATQSLVGRVTEHWLKEYKLDGFRFDLSKGFTQTATCDANGNNCNVGQFGNYDASRVAIWKRYYDTVQTKSNGAYVILEHFADDNEEIALSDYGMLLWGNLNYNFNEATMGYVNNVPENSNFERGIHTVRGWNKPYLVTYMESHDEERILYKNINFGNVSGSYSTKDIATGLKRNEMAAAFCFMMPGPKMIWQFEEIGYDFPINYCGDGTINNNCRTDAKPIKWDYLQNANRKKLYDVYAALFKLRVHPLFKDGFMSNRVERSLVNGLKWLKVTTDTSNLIVVGNFDVTTVSGTITFQNSGTWYDYLTNQTLTVTGSSANLTLQPGEYHIYLNRNITGVSTPVNDINDPGKNTRLHIYPNPANKNTVIEYELPENAAINISLLSLHGQQLAKLYSGFKAKGTYKLPFNSGPGLVKGMYLVQLQWGNYSKIQKLLIQ
jgi:1,4-alpha-glucan branching enzyme